MQVSAQGQSCYTYQFINSGNGKCWFAYGQQPNLTVTIPVPGTPAAAIPILPNEIVIYNLVPNAFFSVICGSGDTTTLEITPGEGM